MIQQAPNIHHSSFPINSFALIGAAGYVAVRHLQAISATGNTLAAALDPNDSVGILDSYFPEAAFFTEFERFDRHIEKLRRNGRPVQYMSICSPNYLHDAHIRYALRYGAEVICEKPLVLNPWNLDALKEMERETGRKVWTILQLRHHPEVIALKNKVESAPDSPPYDVELTYITPRGKWYHASWKGDESKSGGIITNIGIHLFDMLQWVFGPVLHAEVHQRDQSRAAGFLQFSRARVRWFLSIDAETLPSEAGKGPLRTLTLDGQAWNFSEGFTNLHQESYRHILEGHGWSLEDAGPSIELTSTLRRQEITEGKENAHPLVHLPGKGQP